MKKVMVIGGAGYVGSHTIKMLGERGCETLVYDNLSKGRRNSVLCGRFVEGDVADATTLYLLRSRRRKESSIKSLSLGTIIRHTMEYVSRIISM